MLRERFVVSSDSQSASRARLIVWFKDEEDSKYEYEGETAHTAYERGADHLDALRKLDSDSHLLRR